jgi:hypothetical protein
MIKPPFIAWTCAQDYNSFAPDLKNNCEYNLRKTHKNICDISGEADLEGIIIYDNLAQGLAIASLLNKNGHTLPISGEGELCDKHFDGDELCSENNAQYVLASLHSGSKGMLITLQNDPNRRIMLLQQNEALNLSTIGRPKDINQIVGTTGLLAHELGHSRDYANGRPGMPSLEQIEKQNPHAGSSVHTVLNMALAEYVATRDECFAQTSLHQGCSPELTRRISSMARREFKLPNLTPIKEDGQEKQQHTVDLSTAGYVIGTLAGYADAKADILTQEGYPQKQSTDTQIDKNIPNNSVLGKLLKRLGPELNEAYKNPNSQTQQNIAEKFNTTLQEINTPKKIIKPKIKKDPMDEIWGF